MTAVSSVVADSGVPLFRIIRLSSFGDLLRFLPLARSLKLRYPGCVVEWIVADRYRSLIELSPYVDKVIPIRMHKERPYLPRPGAVLRRVVADLGRRYDAVIDAHCSHWTNLMTLGTRAGRRLSIDRANEFGWRPFAHVPLSGRATRVPVDYFLSVLELLDIRQVELDLDLAIPPDGRQEVMRILAAAGIDDEHQLVMIHPGSSCEFKNWPPEHFAHLVRELVRQPGVRVLLVGTPLETPIFSRLLPSGLPAPAIVTGLDFPALAGLLARATVFVGNDSGPLHLAAAMGVATIGLFGPSDPRIHTPYGPRSTILSHPVACAPCFDGFHVRDACHTGTRECLRDLSPGRVIDLVLSRLARRPQCG